MTNKEDENDSTPECKPPLATLLAVHLVSQVLDEAYIIANAAKETGQPWRCLSMLKNFKGSRLCESDDEDISFEASKDDIESKVEMVANVVATSTPQKLTTKHDRHSDESVSPLCEYMGQGDEDLDIHMNQIDLTKSTSEFINNLFDMSDVEHGTKAIEDKTEDELVNTNMPDDETVVEEEAKAIENNTQDTDDIQTKNSENVSKSDKSEYSFLVDAYATDISDTSTNVAFFINDEPPCDKDDRFQSAGETTETDETMKIEDEETDNMDVQKNDVDYFENAYVTLNRDYDQCSDEDDYPILQDPKDIVLQEVELMTADTSEDNLSYPKLKRNIVKDEVATVSAETGSRKSTLVRRCRIQGARFLACIRGWWRRKVPGKRKETIVLNATKGICPLSPDVRRRTSSLLDNRLLRSPSPSRPAVWKFNTVNEALVNSNRWKDYTFENNVEHGGAFEFKC